MGSPTRSFERHRLEALERIATGGTGHVFRARQPHLDRYVAVKRLKEELEGQQEIRERFRREARSLASLAHHNIVQVYDFVEDDGHAYLLMEYIDGVDLSVVVEKLGSLPGPIAAAILLSIARGVDYLHGRGLIHRDIKPANIRLTTAGEVKLMDFGIALDTGEASLTRPGSMVGSPSYLSPEQVLGDPLTPRADIFLLGITLYEMLAGTRPFRAEQGETVYQRIREGHYIPLREASRGAPRALVAIAERCLRKEPSKRFSSAKKLIAALEAYLGDAATAHIPDLLLGFFDKETVLEPSVRYLPRVVSVVPLWRKPIFHMFLTAILATLLAFAIGWKLGAHGAPQEGLPGYAPPRPANGKPFTR